MGKALMVSLEGASLGSGVEGVFGGRFNNTTESQSQYSATEGVVLSNLRARVQSGNSGTATFRLRDSGANGAQSFTISGAASNEDTVNTDTLTAGDTFNLGYTDTGTNAVVGMVAMNVAMSSGHGCFHCAASSAAVVCDLASTTSYFPIQGEIIADGTLTIGNAEWKNRGYTSVEAIQVRVTANARTNDSVFRLVVNGTPTGTAITYAAGATGRQTVTGMGVSLSPGDLVCLQLTLGAGVEDLSISFVGATLKSTSNASEVFGCANQSVSRAASSTPSYYLPGSGLLSSEATETTERVMPGFAAKCSNLRLRVSVNTHTGDATLKLMVNGVAQITLTITAAATGWLENTTDTWNINSTDEISFEIDEGTANSMSISAIGVTLEQIAEPAVVTPTGGWTFPPQMGRAQTPEERREERERLGIIPRQQKGLDRAARSIAKRVDPGIPPEELQRRIAEAKEFDKIMADLAARNQQIVDGLSLMIMQAIQARILEELRDEDDAIAMLLLEM